MKSIGIYRTAYPLASETFIDQQMRSLIEFNPVMITRTQMGSIDFDHISLNRLSWGGLRSRLFSITALPGLFGKVALLDELKLIHAHFGPDATYALPLAGKLEVPLIVTFHGYDCTLSKSALLSTGKISDFRFIFFEKYIKSRASIVIAVSAFVHKILLNRGYREEQIFQHYIGVDIERFKPLNHKPKKRYVLCVGRHTEKKGIDVLLRAFAHISMKHKEVNLIQVGTGQLSTELKALTVSLGIEERVNFLGEKTSDEVLHLMQSAEIFVLPSCTAKSGDSEALGIVFNEASACEIPIVSTHHGGIPEAVLDGETGFLVQERDDVSLAERMDYLLNNPCIAREMGKKGREYVSEVFDLHKQTKKLETLYKEIIK